MQRQLRFILYFFIGIFTLASLRLSYLALGNNSSEAAEIQSSYTLTVDTPRGTIYDRNMKHISNGEESYRAVLTATPSVISELYKQLSKSRADLLVEELRKGKPICTEVPSGFSATGCKTFLCYNKTPSYQPAAQLVGYLDYSFQNGVCGLQSVFNSLLSCDHETKTVYACGATGTALAGLEPNISIDMSQYEKGVITTLDVELQNICEEALKMVERGAVVITRTGSGEILAMASAPTFSLDKLDEALKNPDSPFVNRALSEYNLGSIFKICVVAAAVENGISTDFSYDCTGLVEVGNKFHCHKKEGHGVLNMTGAFSVSCNTYFINLAQKVGADKIFQTAKKLGLSSENVLCDGISGSSGGLGNLEEIRNVPAALANFSIGQGGVMVTPLQISQLVNTVANGGVYFPPYLISGIVDQNGETKYEKVASGYRAISTQTADTLKNMMRLVMTEGTGVAGKPKTGDSGGKTATAETGWTDPQGVAKKNAWFAGFYNTEAEGYSISILVDGGTSGSSDAAPIFKCICDKISENQ